MDLIKKVVCFILIGVVGFITFYCISLIGDYQEKGKEEQISRNRAVAEGRVIKTGSMKGSYAVVEYLAKGRPFTIKDGSPAEDIRIGQVFKVEYDSIEPSVSRILFEYPLFSAGSAIDSTYGIIVLMDNFKLRFEYTVAGKVYTKFQKYKKTQGIEEGKKFRVQYLIARPDIAFIKLNYL